MLHLIPDLVAGMKIPGYRKVVSELLRHKLVGYDHSKCKCALLVPLPVSKSHPAVKYGYRLTYPGYDHLALRVFANRDVINWFELFFV